MVRVEPVAHRGKVWCITVPTGAFVARRRGMVFVTGNSGFPKSLDVSKAIDAAAGVERQVVGYGPAHDGALGRMNDDAWQPRVGPTPITAPATPEAQRWAGWGTATKPAYEPAILARKPLEGTVVANVLQYGTGALNIDGCRFAPGDVAWVGPDEAEHATGRGVTGAANSWNAANREHTSGLREWSVHDLGRWPANLYYCPKAPRAERERGCDGLPARSGAEAVDREEDSEGLRSPRAGAGRTAEGVRNWHPCVKPTRIMRWLCRLVTPPGGLVVDPFVGSGTTGVAAALEGFRFAGAEREPDYHAIAVARIAHAARWPASWADTEPGADVEPDTAAEEAEKAGQVSLFGGGR